MPISINLITIATPTYESKRSQINEDPGNRLGGAAINDHIHIYNTIDGVQGGMAGGETYNSPSINIKIDVSSEYNFWEWIDAHSFDVEHPELIKEQTKGLKLKKVEPKR